MLDTSWNVFHFALWGMLDEIYAGDLCNSHKAAQKAEMIELLSCLVSHPVVAARALMYLSGGQWTAPRSHVKKSGPFPPKKKPLTHVCTHAHTYAHILLACVGLLGRSNFQCERMRWREKDPSLGSTDSGASIASSSPLVVGLQPPAGVSFEASQTACVPFFKACATQCGSGRLMFFFLTNGHWVKAAACIVYHSKKVAGSILIAVVFPSWSLHVLPLSLRTLLLPPSLQRQACYWLTCISESSRVWLQLFGCLSRWP